MLPISLIILLIPVVSGQFRDSIVHNDLKQAIHDTATKNPINRNDVEMNEIVYGLLNVGYSHPDPRIAAGAVFLAGIQASRYIKTLAVNTIMRYVVMNGSLITHFGDPRQDSTASDLEFGHLIDYIQQMIENKEFHYEPLSDPDWESTQAVKLFKEGYNSYLQIDEGLKDDSEMEDDSSMEQDSSESVEISANDEDIVAVEDGSGDADTESARIRDLAKRPRQPRPDGEMLEEVYTLQ